MDKIELKNLLFLARIGAKEEDYPKIIEKLNTTFEMIDQMNEMDLDHFEPLNNPLELTNVSREIVRIIEIAKKTFWQSHLNQTITSLLYLK